MMDNMMLWNILLTMVATGVAWACNKMIQEVKTSLTNVVEQKVAEN